MIKPQLTANNVLDKFYKFLEKDKDRKITLMNGGLGDFIAIESLMSESEKNNFDVIYHIGYRPSMCKPFICAFGKPNDYRYFWHCLNNRAITTSIQNKLKKISKSIKIIKPLFVEDVFKQHKDNKRHYTSSMITNNVFADISKFNLPLQYVVINPFSINPAENFTDRKFTICQWEVILRILNELHLTGIVIGKNCLNYIGENIINLSNQTTFEEALEICKNGNSYLGIDSVFSVVAPKIMRKNRVWIQLQKNTGMLGQNAKSYLAPHGGYVVDEINEQVAKTIKLYWMSFL